MPQAIPVTASEMPLVVNHQTSGGFVAYMPTRHHAYAQPHSLRLIGGSPTVDLQEHVIYDREYRPLRWAWAQREVVP